MTSELGNAEMDTSNELRFLCDIWAWARWKWNQLIALGFCVTSGLDKVEIYANNLRKLLCDIKAGQCGNGRK